MKRKMFMPLLFVGSLLTSPALAHEEEISALLSLGVANANQLGMKEAIDIALKSQPGAIKEARLDRRQDKVVYVFEIYQGMNVQQVEIDPATKEIKEQNVALRDTLANLATLGLCSPNADEVKQLSIELPVALEFIKDPIAAMEIEHEDDAYYYELTVVKNGKLVHMLLNTKTGDVIELQKEDWSGDHRNHADIGDDMEGRPVHL